MAAKKNIIAPEFPLRYINIVKEENVLKAIKKNTRTFKKCLDNIPKKKINYAYAEGKWTIKEMLRHIIDAERVFAYRALSFARKDAAPLPGFDENNWALNAQTIHRKWNDLVDEFKATRKSTELLFESFTEDQLLAQGTASNYSINVIAIGFVIAGHVEHHINIIREKYL
jgi:DinB family protein